MADPGLGVDGAEPAPASALAQAHSKAQSDDSAPASPSASSPDSARAQPQATEPKAQPSPNPLGSACETGANKEPASPAAKKADGLAGKKRGAKTAASARAPRNRRQGGKHGKKRSGAKRKR